MDRLSHLSAAFLTAEDVDPSSALVIGSCAILDGPAPTLDELREHVMGRLDLAPRYRQRLHRTALDLRAPGWTDDPDFDITRHVNATSVPGAGLDAELADLVAEVMAPRMDRQHPLWDITLVDGLVGGRWALVCRVHHALADGVSGTELLRVVYDVDGVAPDEIVGLRVVPGRPSRAGQAWRAVRGGVALGGALAPVHGPSVVGPIHGGRRYAWRRVRISSVHDLRRTLGVSLNDVAFAAVAGGFRTLLEHRGLDPHPHAVRSLVPVSAWSGSATEAPDNHVTLMLAYLPVDVGHAVHRVLVAHERLARLRRAGEPEAGVWAQRLAGVVPHAVVDRATRLLLRVPQHHVSTVTTNVPGPRVPLSCLGHRVEQFLPYVPIADRVQIGVAIFSYCGDLTFGISADRDVEDLEVLADGIELAWTELAGTHLVVEGPSRV